MDKKGKTGHGFDRRVPIQKTCTDMNQLYDVLNQRRWNRKLSPGNDYSNTGFNFVIGTDISLPSAIGVNKSLELPMDSTGQEKFIDYASKGQLLLHLSTGMNGEPHIMGVELAESNKLLTASSPLDFVGTKKIKGTAVGNDTIALNPLQALQFHGMSNNYQAVKDGIYNFRGESGRVDLAPEISETISSRRIAEGGVMEGITPVEISMLMQRESELVVTMRNNELSFTASEKGQAIINEYLNQQLAAYQTVYKEKYTISQLNPQDSSETAMDTRTEAFNAVMSDAHFINLENQNKSKFNLEFAQYQISSLNHLLNSRTLSPETTMMAEEQLKYYESYSRFADLSSEWNERLIKPIRDANSETLTPEEKQDTMAYFSVQNGFTAKNFNQLAEAFASRVKIYRSEVSAVDADGHANIDPAREALYLQQIEYLGEMVRTHPQNPLNKPISPLNSTVDANIQRVDASIEHRAFEFNHSLAVMEFPELTITREMLGQRDLCEAFIKEHDTKASTADELMAVQIVRDTINNNSYKISPDTYREFVVRQNEHKILSAIADTYSNNSPRFTHEALMEAASTGNPNDLRNFLISKLELDYSVGDMDKFFSSPELMAAVTHPESLKDYKQSPADSSLPRHGVEELSDPMQCQKIKQELILALEAERGKSGHVGTLLRDLEILDNHIIENRMLQNENQRVLNNYDFDNPYSLNPTKEQLSVLEKYKNIDTSNPEHFKDPLIVYKYIDSTTKELTDDIDKKYAIKFNSLDSQELTKEELAKQKEYIESEKQTELSQKLENDPRLIVLKDMLKEDNEELRYHADDMPAGVVQRLSLRNDIIDYGCTHKPKELSIENLRNEFGSNPHFESIISQPDMQEAIRIRYFNNLEKSPLSIQDTLDKISVYNGFIRDGKAYEAPEGYANIAEEIRQNKELYSQLIDKKHPLQEVPETLITDKAIDVTNPKECYAYAEMLQGSDNPLAQKFGQELKETMSYMETDLKLRTIYENSKDALNSKDLSTQEIEALKTEAQRQSIACVMKKVEDGSLESGSVNQYIRDNIQDLKGYSSSITPQTDESKLGKLFNPETIALNRDGFVKEQQAATEVSLENLEKSYQKLYELGHNTFQRETVVIDADGNSQKIPLASDAQIVARVEALQSVQDDMAVTKALLDLDKQLQNNRFYEEHVIPLRERDVQIQKLEDRIKLINEPIDKLSTKELEDWLEKNPIDRFSSPTFKSLYTSYADTVASRDAATDAIRMQIADLESSVPFQYSKDPEGMAHNLQEYSKEILEPRIAEMKSLVYAFSDDGIPKADISRKDFTVERLNLLDSEASQRALDLVNFPNNEKSIREAMKSPDATIQPDEITVEAIKLIDETRIMYAKFQDTETFEKFKVELASYENDLKELHKCSAILDAKTALKDYKEATHSLTLSEASSAIESKLGTLDTNIPRISIGGEVVLNSKELSADAKQVVIDSQIIAQDLSKNEEFFERADRALSSGPISPEAERALCSRLTAYYQYQEILESDVAQAARDVASIKLEDGKIPTDVEISSENIVSATISDIKLPENIEKFYEEHISEIADEAQYKTFRTPDSIVRESSEVTQDITEQDIEEDSAAIIDEQNHKPAEPSIDDGFGELN